MMQLLSTTLYTAGFSLLGLFGLRFLALALLSPWAARRAARPTAAWTGAAGGGAPGRSFAQGADKAEAASDGAPRSGGWSGGRPRVTVQLPLYNEAAVAGRAIDALCGLDWPAALLEIQVLDDSTDGSQELVAERVAAWRAQGVDIQHLRRPHRAGYKAGALALGLAEAKGEVLAVFDADFLPPADFLTRSVPYLGPEVGAVQARWGHLNAGQSWLTACQALALDGHFLVEQPCQSRLGLFLNFNGTAGIWRREAILAAGGWQDDCLTEDFDLSYRAQLVGWRIVVLPQLVAPAELPAGLAAYRRQQRRWAMGTAQVLRKLGGRLLRSQQPLHRRLLALLTLSGYLAQPVLLGLLLAAPLALVHPPRLPAWTTVLGLAPLGPPVLYAIALRQLPGRPWRRLLAYPPLMLLTAGLSLQGARAVLAGLSGRSAPFERTPKTGAEGAGAGWTRRAGPGAGWTVGAEPGVGSGLGSGAGATVPAPPEDRAPVRRGLRRRLPEAGLALYAGLCAAAAAAQGQGWLALFCGLLGAGFALVLGQGLHEAGLGVGSKGFDWPRPRVSDSRG